MARYERHGSFHPGNLWPHVTSQRFDDLLLAMTDLVAWYDFHPSRVSGTPMSIANRKSAGIPLVQLAYGAGPTLSTTNLATGGALQQVAEFANNGTLKATGLMPTASDLALTQLIVYKMSNASLYYDNDPVPSNNDLARSDNLSVHVHRIFGSNNNLTGRIGQAASYMDVSLRHPVNSWTWVIRTWDQPTRVQKLSLAGAAWVTGTGDTGNVDQISASADLFIGGSSTAGQLQGAVGAYVQWNGVSGTSGDLSAAGREADLAVAQAYGGVMCGLFDMGA